MADNGKNDKDNALRIFVQGGGCSGFQYGLMIDEDGKTANDELFESSGIQILIDPISIRYVRGAVVDLVEHSEGFSNAGLIIKNPNATSTCGCGQSFNTDEEGHDHSNS